MQRRRQPGAEHGWDRGLDRRLAGRHGDSYRYRQGGRGKTASVKSAMPAGYSMGSDPLAVKGDAFLSLNARFDPTTRKQVTERTASRSPAARS